MVIKVMEASVVTLLEKLLSLEQKATRPHFERDAPFDGPGSCTQANAVQPA